MRRSKGFNLGWLVKILIVTGILLFGFLIYICVFNTKGCGLQTVNSSEPSSTEAPFKVTTRTFNYYAEKAEANKDGSVTMKNWYVLNGKKWTLHKGTEVLPAVLKPKIERRAPTSPVKNTLHN